MWQEIIITDVTRMGEDRVCVAGIDQKGNVFRPLLPYPNAIREHDLYLDNMVMIRPRAVLNMFLEPDADPEPPHIEDHLWIDPNRIEALRYASDDTWKMVLERTEYLSVCDLFGTVLKSNKKSAPGEGLRSLGTLKPASIDKFGYYRLRMDEAEHDDYRLNFTDADGQVFKQIPVTDLSLRYFVNYLRTRGRMHQSKIRDLMEEKLARSEVWLRLGLTRPYQKSDDDARWCYLQVNGIYTFPDYLEGRCFADFAQSMI